MIIDMSDIRRRLNTPAVINTAQFNLNEMSCFTNDKFTINNAMYMIENWQSFDANVDKAFNKALDVFDCICENGSTQDINRSYDVLVEGIQKVRDAKQLMNSIKYRHSHFKSKISTKINKAIHQLADPENFSVKAKIADAIHRDNVADSNKVNGVAEECYSKLEDKAKCIYECDRIIKNYNKVSKRFDLIKMVSECTCDFDIKYSIVKICECIDTYNTNFENKYNTMLELSYYAFGRNNIKVNPRTIIETVTDYFIFNTVMNESDFEAIESIKNNSVLFTEQEFSCINAVCKNINEFNMNQGRGLTKPIIISSYGVELINENKLKEWSKGNPEEHENDDVKEMIDDFRNQCKDKEPANNTVQLKSLINKLFTKNANQIVNGFPNILSLIRVFFILGTCAINPIISLVTLFADQLIKLHLERKQLEKIIDIYKKEIETVENKIEKLKSEEEKDRMDRYLKALNKDLETLTEYERNLYTDEENDERDFSNYEFDDDFNFNDDWDLDNDFLEQNQLHNIAAIITISELVESINEGLLDTDIDGIIYNNIFKFDNDTIDAIADFSVTVPVILEKEKLCNTLESHKEDLRSDFMNNIMRIDCINENIRKIKNSTNSYNVTNDIKGLICTLNWLNEMVLSVNSSYVLEMDFSNTIKLAMNKLKKSAIKLSDKEKQVSNTIDVSMANVSKGIENALTNDSREAIIRGRILPSASKTIKIALATGAAWAVSPAVAIIGVVGAFACSTKLKAKERQLVLDDIEIEIKMCERYLRQAEEKNDMEAIRQIEKTQRSLERQRQRIQYKMAIEYRQKVPEIKDND